MPQEKKILDVRNEIDAIDHQILGLLKKRIECARQIGKLKDATKRAKWDPQREREIYSRILQENDGVFPE
ncbi:Chorismate mutase I / Prephenate dehydratase, partial [hydrothermal vent metagenome]